MYNNEKNYTSLEKLTIKSLVNSNVEEINGDEYVVLSPLDEQELKENEIMTTQYNRLSDFCKKLKVEHYYNGRFF